MIFGAAQLQHQGYAWADEVCFLTFSLCNRPFFLGLMAGLVSNVCFVHSVVSDKSSVPKVLQHNTSNQAQWRVGSSDSATTERRGLQKMVAVAISEWGEIDFRRLALGILLAPLPNGAFPRLRALT